MDARRLIARGDQNLLGRVGGSRAGGVVGHPRKTIPRELGVAIGLGIL